MKFKHSLSNYRLASMDMGELVPVGHFEVLPADMISLATSCLIRVSPLAAPVMHPVTIRLHHWYVPYRLLWDGWEDFITGGNDGLGGSSGAFPYIDAGGSGFTAGQLADYFGIPPGVANLQVNALPFRAYAAIFNEFYRDQDLVTELGLSTGSGADSTTNVTLAKIAWEKDRFTSARPWTQRGTEVVLPLGTSADVVFPTGVTTRGTNIYNASSGGTSRGPFQDTSGSIAVGATNSAQTGSEQLWLESTGTVSDAYADLAAATGVPVIDVRRAFALQRYQEKLAQYGARYTEVLRAMGVTPSDARMQRPEYLGGGKQTISFSEVLQTGQDYDANSGVGQMKGHGISALRSRRVKRFIEEHGIIISMASVRPKTMYADGLHKMWSRRTKEDFWQKELETIGAQEILNQEVRASHADPTGVFGYGPRYEDYRSIPSTVVSEFRTSVLNDWHLARLFASDPALNASFVTCEPSKRIHQVSTNDVLWGLFNHTIRARRLVAKNPGTRIM